MEPWDMASPIERRRRRRLNVLLVEDSPLDATLLEARMENEGLSFELARVSDEEAFTEALERRCPDVILSDYNVPGFEGPSVLAASHERCPETPFIFVSGALGEERAIELLKSGATDYVLKDKLERLVPCIERALCEVEERAERRAAEKALRESSQRSRALIAALGEGVVVHDLNGLVREMNAAADRLLGETFRAAAARLPCDPPWAAVNEDGSPLLFDDLPAMITLRTGEPQHAAVIGVGRPDQSVVWLSVNAQPLLEGDGKTLAGVVSSFFDISDRKRAENEIHKRVEFEQQILGIVSHDLRNPIGAIAMAAHLLLKLDPMPDRAHKYAARIISSADRASRLIRDLLDFTQARLGSGIQVERREANLDEIASRVVEELRLAWPEREISFVPCGRGQGSWDPDRIGQILENLVTNALRYGDTARPVSVTLVAAAGEVRIDVHNDGPPIPPELLPHLFQAMSRGTAPPDRAARSIGLGLFIVDHLVRAHGGQIEVHSAAGEGTTFAVRFPRHVSPAPPKGAEETAGAVAFVQGV